MARLSAKLNKIKIEDKLPALEEFLTVGKRFWRYIYSAPMVPNSDKSQ